MEISRWSSERSERKPPDPVAKRNASRQGRGNSHLTIPVRPIRGGNALIAVIRWLSLRSTTG